MAKKSISRRGYNYFQNLPDELVICIFTKLSSSCNDDHDSHADLKALVPCLSVSRRFNKLACHVPTFLSINVREYFINELFCHVPATSSFINLPMLYKYCPNILRKFKNIRSLKVTHWSDHELPLTNPPLILWEAAYRPHSYCLVVVSDMGNDPQSLEDKDEKYYKSVWSHTEDMFRLHHMLVSSIKDLRHLQRVVVTDSYELGTLIIEDDTLAALRNCTSTHLEHVIVRHSSGSAIDLKIGNVKLEDVCFSFIEWRKKATDNRSHEDEDVTGIPTDLPDRGRLITKNVLRHLLETPGNVEVNDSKEILNLLSNVKSDGNLL